MAQRSTRMQTLNAEPTRDPGPPPSNLPVIGASIFLLVWTCFTLLGVFEILKT